MSCCDTLSEKNNQLRYDYVELMSKELDLEIEVKRLRKAIIEVAFDEHESVYEMKQALVKVIE